MRKDCDDDYRLKNSTRLSKANAKLFAFLFVKLKSVRVGFPGAPGRSSTVPWCGPLIVLGHILCNGEVVMNYSIGPDRWSLKETANEPRWDRSVLQFTNCWYLVFWTGEITLRCSRYMQRVLLSVLLNTETVYHRYPVDAMFCLAHSGPLAQFEITVHAILIRNWMVSLYYTNQEIWRFFVCGLPFGSPFWFLLWPASFSNLVDRWLNLCRSNTFSWLLYLVGRWF